MRILPSLVMVVVMAAPAHADFAWLVPILQPVESDGGPVACITTYSAYYAASDEACALMRLTVAPNAIVMSSGQPVDCNIAAQAKIRLQANQNADSLFVSVDAPKETPSITIAMTLWCGLRNVRRAWPKVRYVIYRLPQRGGLEKYSGLYDLEPVEPVAASHSWDPTVFGPTKR
jgi:hypothetical protein